MALAIVLYLSPGTGIASEDLSGEIPVSVFSAAHGYQRASLSPWGNHIATLDIVDNQVRVSIFELADDGIVPVKHVEFRHSQIDQIRWVTETNLLVSQTVVPQEITRTFERNLVSIDLETGAANVEKTIEMNRLAANEASSIGRVVDPYDGTVLISASPDSGFFPALYLLNVRTGDTTLVERSAKGIVRWMTDWDGQVRLAMGVDSSGDTVARYRNTVNESWTDLSDVKIFSSNAFEVFAFNRAGDHLFLMSALGSGRNSLYEYSLERMRITRKIYENPRYDIAYPILGNFDREVAAVAYIDDYLRVEYLDDALRQLAKKIDQQLPGATNTLLEASVDFETVLIVSNHAPYPVRYFVYRPKEKRLEELPFSGQAIRKFDLVVAEPVSYFSRDGLEIHGYITRPPDVAEPAPTVVLPHGGPWVRDYVVYNDWAQFFANRGYVVFQPNFRGSAGFGALFQARGYGEWGRAMQADLEDGVEWLVETGVSDEQNICIAGASYGGYAALEAAVADDGMFKCAISFAPVTDLIEYVHSFSGSPQQEAMYQMVVGRGKEKDLRAVSPVRNAKRLSVPLLLIHGTSDIRVPVSHSRRFARAAKKSNADFRYIELDGGSHFLSLPVNRRIVFDAMESHLSKYLSQGGRQP